MKVPLGSLVGFQVSLHRELNRAGEKTKVLYCTTGVITQKLTRTKSMNNYTHIILGEYRATLSVHIQIIPLFTDEIHERDIEMDFLLILIREYLHTNSKDTKIILMSATLNAEQFASYFRTETMSIPIISMADQRQFTIKKKFLDDLRMEKSAKIINYESPGISDEMMQLAAEIVFEHVQKDNKSSILIFLPGLYEIDNFERALLYKFDVCENFLIVILHSAVTPDDQKLAFKSDDKPKIILSTNIAENSVTIPKVNVIVDFCLTKYLVSSPDCNLASLQLNWTSRMSSEQRAGRTGRVCHGIVYHLVPKQFYEHEMPTTTDPEMKRIPLERVVLQTKLLARNVSPMNFLSLALDPPEYEHIRTAILMLKQVGAMQRCNENGEFEDDDGELTFCGRIMANLPCDIYIGKFIVLGYVFSVLEEAVIIGAGLNINGSIFRFDFKRKLQSYRDRLTWSSGSGSDLHAILYAYQMWRLHKRNGEFVTQEIEQQWIYKNNLDRKNLHEMKELVDEMMARLEDNRIKVFEEFQPIIEKCEKSMMLKICAAGAWLPYYYLQETITDSTERVAFQEVGTLNVLRTVYFKPPDNTYHKLYNDLLKRALIQSGICKYMEDIQIKYDCNRSTKIFVTFARAEKLATKDNRGITAVDGLILPEVYVATKHKEISRGNFPLYVVDLESMREFARQVGPSKEANDSFLINSSASSSTLGIHKMKGVVSYVEDCGKFFFQPTGQQYDFKQKMIEFRIKMVKMTLKPITAILELTNDDKVLINYDGTITRGIVIKKDDKLQYNLIDIGLITSDIELCNVYHCPKKLTIPGESIFDIPPRCFECTLKGISPNPRKNPQGVWTQEAIEYFKGFVEGKTDCEIEIYSVVEEVVSVTLFNGNYNVNSLMTESKYAMECDESYNSRLNHEERSTMNTLSFINTTLTGTEEIEHKARPKKLLEPPQGMCNTILNLSGPHSPLESHLHGVTSFDSLKIQIDPSSVNAVVLNGDVSSICSRFYVAASVTKNRSDGVTLRNVVMMPNIDGLAEILALIFCTKMVLRRNEDDTRYVILQTGLGCDPLSKEAYFPVNDAIFPVLMKLGDDDFEMINQLRCCMSTLLLTEPNVEYPELMPAEKYKLQVKAKQLIVE